MKDNKWTPLDPGKLKEIKDLFNEAYPEGAYGNLAEQIGGYWTGLLEDSWKNKGEALKALDLEYNPDDPLLRVEQKTTVITYADSISRKGEKSLETLDKFLHRWFPAVGGIHILPACTVVEDRFNDGYFSQVERNNIHSAFGTNELFADIVHRYFSMNDLVLGHVDIENPVFKDYLAGDDAAGRKFYTFTFPEYKKLKAAGSFDKVFRPRPFPLFTVFRRLPVGEPFRSLSHTERAAAMAQIIRKKAGVQIQPELLDILWLFEKILNDQMLLAEDYKYIPVFIDWMKNKGMETASVFVRSTTQEVQHEPYIFQPQLKSRQDLLEICGLSREEASIVARIFKEENYRIFGEEVRALTTFSHVQVDVNTATFEGLKALADDLVWYLTKDLNMLRLDAVNYAFKKWGTSCFGLPELDLLMRIIYLSMECISPRIIPNLEVNDSLTAVLKQMTAETAAPPMMHDFHLASLLPAVFHFSDPEIIGRIFSKINEFSVSPESIRFSLSESHDGKSVRGSMDILTFKERMVLTDGVIKNNGHVKYKSIPERKCTEEDLIKFCSETSIDYTACRDALFTPGRASDSVLEFKPGIKTVYDIFGAVPELEEGEKQTAEFFFQRLLQGQDPYELCITTRNSLPHLDDPRLEAQRFLAFQTLAFAVMGRNVKTIYFNDLLGLPNDYERVERTGELRDIKRTKVDYDALLPDLEDRSSFTGTVAGGINNLIALVDSDPALHFRGREAEVLDIPGGKPCSVILNRCGENRSITVVNLTDNQIDVDISVEKAGFAGLESLMDNISASPHRVYNSELKMTLPPFGRLWFTADAVNIPAGKLVE